MYESGKIWPVETAQGMGVERMMDWVNSTMIYFKNFGKCHNGPSVQQ
jgi:hypothetical protein